VDKDTARLLKEIAEDVETLLAHNGEFSSTRHTTIKERLEDSARHFEVSHPSLASTINIVVNTLNKYGNLIGAASRVIFPRATVYATVFLF